jgi:hypothetical protein
MHRTLVSITAETGGFMDDMYSSLLAEAQSIFAAQRSLAERAIAQLDEVELFRTAGDDQNSVAVLMKHVGGNLRSRWLDPLTTDGEKPDRNRDGEFEIGPHDSAAAVHAVWHGGWHTLEETFSLLRADDLERTVMIRQQPLTLLQALHRSLAHTAQHVGQIVLLARLWRGREWQTLSMPRGESESHPKKPPP